MRTTYGKIHVLITAIVWTLEKGAGVQAQRETDSCTSATQQDEATDPKMSVDFGSGSRGHYGIPISFNLDTYWHEVTMCSWIRHHPDQLHTARAKYNYYLSYKYKFLGTQYYNGMGLYTGAFSAGYESVGIWITGRWYFDYTSSTETVYDGDWHSICGSWRWEDGKVALYKDGNPIWAAGKLQQGYSVYPGGELVIGQQWSDGGFTSNSYVQGQIGAVEIWKKYMDSNEIQCVSNCWSIGNAFHLNWNLTAPQGKLNELTWTGKVCCDDGVTSQKTALDFGDGSTEQYGYPTNFDLTMNRYELTMCAWVRHSASRPQKRRYSYYLSYKRGGDYDRLGLYTRREKSGTEYIGMRINGDVFLLAISPADVYDGKWHSICGSWRGSDRRASLYRDGVVLGSGVVGELKNEHVPYGGNLVICQRFDSRGFLDKRYCYGEVGAVEMWDYYMDSKKILCVSNCGSEGNLFHLDGNMMESVGYLGNLPKTENLCWDSSTTSVSATTTTTPWTTSTTTATMTSSSTIPAVSTSTDSTSSTVYEVMNTSTTSGNVSRSTVQENVDGHDLMMVASEPSGGGMIGGIVGGIGGFILIIVIIAVVIIRRRRIKSITNAPSQDVSGNNQRSEPQRKQKTSKPHAGSGNDVTYEMDQYVTVSSVKTGSNMETIPNDNLYENSMLADQSVVHHKANNNGFRDGVKVVEGAVKAVGGAERNNIDDARIHTYDVISGPSGEISPEYVAKDGYDNPAYTASNTAYGAIYEENSSTHVRSNPTNEESSPVYDEIEEDNVHRESVALSKSESRQRVTDDGKSSTSAKHRSGSSKKGKVGLLCEEVVYSEMLPVGATQSEADLYSFPDEVSGGEHQRLSGYSDVNTSEVYSNLETAIGGVGNDSQEMSSVQGDAQFVDNELYEETQ